MDQVRRNHSWVKGFLSILIGLAMAGIFVYYWPQVANKPTEIIYAYWVFLAFGALAVIFIIETIENRVKWYRWLLTWMESWLAYFFGMISLIAVWSGCYWVVVNYAGEYVSYFKWGAYIAGGACALMLVFNEPLVYFSMDLRRVRKREDCPELWDAVTNVTPWHARPLPRIYLIPDSGMNAISFGWGIPFFTAVGATTGLIKRLNQDELEAVMAHEIGHVINKDILITMIMAFTTMVMATTGWLLWRLGPFAGGDSKDSSDNSSGGLVGLLIALAIGAVLYGFGRILGAIMQAFVSRQREYAADATSARIVGSSEPLKSALRKVVANPSIGSGVSTSLIGFLCTADPDPGDVLDTHPSLEKRIRALDALQ